MNNLFFRFDDVDLQNNLINLLKENNFPCVVDKTRMILFSSKDEEQFENQYLSKIRNLVFDKWQLLFVSDDWVEAYRSYMKLNNLEFKEEIFNGKRNFLLPFSYDVDSWNVYKSAVTEYRLKQFQEQCKKDEEKLMSILENKKLERRKLPEKSPEVKCNKSFIQKILSIFN